MTDIAYPGILHRNKGRLSGCGKGCLSEGLPGMKAEADWKVKGVSLAMDVVPVRSL